jgi:tetratricopeptide (TPR) repeat protein
MWDQDRWRRFRSSAIAVLNLLIKSPIFFIITAFAISYLLWTIYYIQKSPTPNAALSEKLGVLSILVGLLSILYALYSTISTTKELEIAQKRLGDIQIDYWNTRGIDLYKQKNYRDADLSYDKALNLSPKDTKIWMNMAVSLYEQSKLDEALNAINQAIEIDQKRADSWNTKGLILYKKAIKASEKQIELDNDHKDVKIRKYAVPYAQPIILENQMDQNNENSGVWRNKDEALFEQSRIALEKAIEIRTIEQATKPNNVAGNWLDKGWLAGIYSNLGLILTAQRKYGKALEACDKAIGLDQKYFIAWMNKGDALASSGRPHEAIGAYNKAIELDPKNANPWLGKGNALMKIAVKHTKENSKSVYDEAIYAFNKAIEFDPFQLNAWYEKGRALFEEGYFSEAIKALDTVIDIKPHDQNAWHNKCLCFYNLNKHDEAIKASNITIALYEIYALCWLNKYNELYELGKYDDALIAYEKGVSI